MSASIPHAAREENGAHTRQSQVSGISRASDGRRRPSGQPTLGTVVPVCDALRRQIGLLGLKAKIHRGAEEIGGSCIEVCAADGSRLVLDLGRPLWADWNQKVDLPPVSGFIEPDPSLLGLIISHPHLDHYGLTAELTADVSIYIGRQAESLIKAASFFSPLSRSVEAAGHLAHRQPLVLGPFTITPFLNDHSAFDAYSLLIEADGGRLFYTGDMRAHGRKHALFAELLSQPPLDIDVLLMEGTHIRPDSSGDDAVFDTEADLEDRLAALSTETKGAVVVLGSAQNLDRVVTAFRAARRSSRELVVDLYGATVAASTRASIPQPGFDGLRVYVPRRQRVLVKESRQFWRTNAIRDHRIFPEELAADPSHYLFHVPSSSVAELISSRVLEECGVAVWSMWDGYLASKSGLALQQLLRARGIPLTSIHTSGHASVSDLRRLVDSLKPGRVVPIHSEAGDRFDELFPRVDRQADGEWWGVG